MKLEIFNLSAEQLYRLKVFCRVLLASIAGFVIANLMVGVIGLGFSKQQAIATYTGLLFSFIVWLIFIIMIFSIKKIRHTVLLSFSLIIGLSVMIYLLKLWRAA